RKSPVPWPSNRCDYHRCCMLLRDGATACPTTHTMQHQRHCSCGSTSGKQIYLNHRLDPVPPAWIFECYFEACQWSTGVGLPYRPQNFHRFYQFDTDDISKEKVCVVLNLRLLRR